MMWSRRGCNIFCKYILIQSTLLMPGCSVFSSLPGWPDPSLDVNRSLHVQYKHDLHMRNTCHTKHTHTGSDWTGQHSARSHPLSHPSKTVHAQRCSAHCSSCPVSSSQLPFPASTAPPAEPFAGEPAPCAPSACPVSADPVTPSQRSSFGTPHTQPIATWLPRLAASAGAPGGLAGGPAASTTACAAVNMPPVLLLALRGWSHASCCSPPGSWVRGSDTARPTRGGPNVLPSAGASVGPLPAAAVGAARGAAAHPGRPSKAAAGASAPPLAAEQGAHVAWAPTAPSCTTAAVGCAGAAASAAV